MNPNMNDILMNIKASKLVYNKFMPFLFQLNSFTKNIRLMIRSKHRNKKKSLFMNEIELN